MIHMIFVFLKSVFEDYFVVAHRKDHPLTQIADITINDLLAQKHLNVSQRLTGKDIPIIDPKNEGKSLKDKFMRLMQTKIF